MGSSDIDMGQLRHFTLARLTDWLLAEHGPETSSG
jgi:hypothetical protein